MTVSTVKKRPLLTFFLLGAVLYSPFVLFSKVEVFPNITLVNFGTFIPVAAALILVYREKAVTSKVQRMPGHTHSGLVGALTAESSLIV